MTLKAKTLLKDRFWIVEDNEKRIGTLTWDEDRYMFTDSKETRFFENNKQLKTSLGLDLKKAEVTINSYKSNTTFEVHGYPTSVHPYNTMYDIKRKLPLFTKSEKSKSLYCAGYYIVRFEKGWVKSFCPKLITLERYPFQGPFKSDAEMKTVLNQVNKL